MMRRSWGGCLVNDERLAKRRWAAMQACRLAALICALLGVYALAERGLDQPQLGYPLLLLGAFGFFALPVLLARRWKSR